MNEAVFPKERHDSRLQNEFNLNLNVSLFAFEIYLCQHCFVKKTGSDVFIMKIIIFIEIRSSVMATSFGRGWKIVLIRYFSSFMSQRVY